MTSKTLNQTLTLTLTLTPNPNPNPYSYRLGAAGAKAFQAWLRATHPSMHVGAFNDTICYDHKVEG